MTTEYSGIIKSLFQEYYKGNISVGEYRAQRKAIIDQMDTEFNGFDNRPKQTDPEKVWTRPEDL